MFSSKTSFTHPAVSEADAIFFSAKLVFEVFVGRVNSKLEQDVVVEDLLLIEKGAVHLDFVFTGVKEV